MEGDSVKFNCAVDANPSDSLVYVWSIGGKVIPGESTPSLLVDSVDRRLNNHRVKCEVTNNIGRSEAESVLNVSCK